jgi:hypothetical protein
MVNWVFGDGFDLYAVAADLTAGYWDSGSVLVSLSPGRFAGSRSIQSASSGPYLVKSSNSNDTIHHIVCAYQQASVLSGTNLGYYFTLGDSATAQVSIVFRQDGAILLVAGAPTGTVLATYPNAVTQASSWFAFELEVVIHATAGSFTVRRNGNPSNDFTIGSLHTAQTANNYANRITIGVNNSIASIFIDDFLWRSDGAAVPFVGDIRCYTRMAATDASIQFAGSGSRVTTLAGSGGNGATANTAYYEPATIAWTGTISAVTVGFFTNFTGNVKCALFNDAAGAPGSLLAAATNILTNPAAISQQFNFSGVNVTIGQRIWIGICPDTTNGSSVLTVVGTLARATSPPYASFPGAISGYTPGSGAGTFASTIVFSPLPNSMLVAEPQQDGASTYVFDATVGDIDLYGIASLALPPVTTVATTVRAFMEKSDAGSRSASALMKSGGTLVATPTQFVQTTWAWYWRTDQVDPATGAAWTAAAVDNVQVGQTVVA